MDIIRGILSFVRKRGLFVILAFVAISSVHTGIRLGGQGEAIAEAEARLKQEQARQAELEAIKQGLDSTEFIEQQARDKLGLAREGETIVVLPSEEVLRSLAPRDELNNEEFELEKRAIWRQWLHMFVPEVEEALRG